MQIPNFTVMALAMAALLGGCSPGCENEVARSIASPSREFKAVVFHRGCGATTGFNTQVSVLPMAKQLPNDEGNAFIIDGSVPLQIHWASESRLLVTGRGPAKVFKQESMIGQVEVSYAN